MNNEHCWYNLNLDVTGALRSDFILNEPPWTIKYSKIATDFFTDEWIKYVNSVGISIVSVMIFYRSPNDGIGEAHSDIYFDSCGTMGYRSVAINWAIGGGDSAMEWYKQPEHLGKLKHTLAKTQCLSWSTDNLVKIDQVTIGKSTPTLVRVDLPHRVVIGSEPRIGISIRPMDQNNWKKATHYLKFKKILIERN
jgi:hypothetical protein